MEQGTGKYGHFSALESCYGTRERTLCRKEYFETLLKGGTGHKADREEALRILSSGDRTRPPGPRPIVLDNEDLDIRILQERLNEPGVLWVENWTRDSPLDLRELRPKATLILVHCRFREELVADHTVWEGPVQLWGCICEKGLTLSGATFLKGVHFHNCYFGYAPHEEPVRILHPRLSEAPARERSAWWPGLRVSGIFRADRCSFAGSLNLAESVIDGPLLLRGVFVGAQERKHDPSDPIEARAAGRLYLRQIRVEGDIDLQPHLRRRDLKTKRSSTVMGSIVLSSARVSGRLDVRGALIWHRLHMPMVHIGNRFLAGSWVHPSDKEGREVLLTEIGGTEGVAVRLADSVIDHGVWMDGAQLYGQMNAKNARIGGDFYLRRARNDEGESSGLGEKFRNEEFRARVLMPPASVTDKSDALRLFGAEIQGSVELDDTYFRGVLNFDNVTIGGDFYARQCRVLSPQEPDAAREFVMTIAKFRAARITRNFLVSGTCAEGGIELQRAEIKGNLEFGPWPDSATTEPKQGVYHGSVNLTGILVGGELRLGQGEYKGPVIAEGARFNQKVIIDRATMTTVDFDEAEIGGGLWIGDLPEPPRSHPVLASSDPNPNTLIKRELTMRRAIVNGDVVIKRLKMDEAGERPSTKVLVDLRLAEIKGSFRVGAKIEFGTEQAKHGRYLFYIPCSLRLSQAKIGGHLQLRSTYVRGDVQLDGAKVGGNIVLDYSTVKGEIDLSGCNCQSLFGAELGSDDAFLSHESTEALYRIGKSILAEGGRFGNVLIQLKEYRPLSERQKQLVPRAVSFAHSQVKLLKVVGELDKNAPPYLDFTGLSFEELDISTFNLRHKEPSLGRREVPPTHSAVQFVESTKLDPSAVVRSARAFLLSICRCFKRFRRRNLSADREPQHYADLLRQMARLDAGLYSRVEGWLRQRGLFDEADRVYLERRLLETEDGALMLLFYQVVFRISGVLRRFTRRHKAFRTLFKEFTQRARFRMSKEGACAYESENTFEKWRSSSGTSTKQRFCVELWRRLKQGVRRHWFLKFRLTTIGDGVRIGRLFVLSVLYLGISLIGVFSDPESVKHPLTYISGQVPIAEIAADNAKPSGGWGYISSFWVTLNIHVPLAEFVSHDDWEPSSTVASRGFLGAWNNILSYCFNITPSITYEKYGGFMQVYGWLSVPLLLTWMTGLLRRRSGSD